MNLQATINQDLIAAMKSGDEVKKTTLRSVKTAITRAEKEENGQPLNDDQVIAIIRKQGKQRQDSIDAYQQGGRLDLVCCGASRTGSVRKLPPRADVGRGHTRPSPGRDRRSRCHQHA